MRGWTQLVMAAALAAVASPAQLARAQAHDLHYCHAKFQRAMQAIDFVGVKLDQALEANDPKMIQAVISMAQPHLAKLKERIGECRELVLETCPQCQLKLTSAK